MKPDYGIDAPGVRRGMLAAAAAGLLLALASLAGRPVSGWASILAALLAGCGVAVFAYGSGMAGYMTYGSRVGKLRERERLLDLAQTMLPWTGNETVLDVGCGRGLMLVGAARRLTDGRAVGIDLWRAADQSGNTPDAALENARREGVLRRVAVETGDARALPFADASFDLVLSHWVVHNLPSAGDRGRALQEMVRVLRPGGVLVLADIANHASYKDKLQTLGLADLREDTGGWASLLLGILSGGSFRPQAIIGRTPASASDCP